MSARQFTDEELSGPVVDRRTTLQLLSAAGMAGLAGCAGGPSDGGGGASPTETPSPTASPTATATSTPPPEQSFGGSLTAGWFIGSIETLDPPYISVGQYFQVAANVFNGLVWLKRDLTIRGDLATDWTIENDGKKFTFQLREGVTFHNGTEFTAEDVKYTIDRTISEETPAAARLSFLEPVDDGGVIVHDDYTVELNWKQPMAPALIYLTRGPGRAVTVVNREAIEEMGQKQYALTPVGTGPFEVTEHQVGAGLTLTAYDDYFKTDEQDNPLPYLDEVQIKPISEPATIINALRSGDIQFINVVPLQNVSTIDESSSTELLAAPGINWLGLAMNQEREPFNSRKARLAIAKVIDNEQYVDAAYFGNALPSVGPLNKATGWVWRSETGEDDLGGERKDPSQNTDKEEGTRLLSEAGAEGAEFSILVTQGDTRAAKALRNQLNGVAGMTVELDQVPNATYWDRFSKLDYDVTITGSVGDPDPDQSLWNFYRVDGPWNWTAFQNDRVHDLLAAQRGALDRETRRNVLWELEDELIRNAPHAYLAHRTDVAAKRPGVRGFVHIPFMRYLQTVWLEE